MLACVAPGCTVLYVYAFVFLPTVHTSYGLLPLCREQSRRTLKVEIEAATPYPIARALQQPMQSTQKVSKRHPRRTQEAPRGTEKVYIYIYIHMRIYIYIYIYIFNFLLERQETETDRKGNLSSQSFSSHHSSKL